MGIKMLVYSMLFSPPLTVNGIKKAVKAGYFGYQLQVVSPANDPFIQVFVTSIQVTFVNISFVWLQCIAAAILSGPVIVGIDGWPHTALKKGGRLQKKKANSICNSPNERMGHLYAQQGRKESQRSLQIWRLFQIHFWSWLSLWGISCFWNIGCVIHNRLRHF